MSKLLIDDYPIMVLPKLAHLIGLNESIVLQQIHYWQEKSNNNHDDRTWIYNSYPDWQKQFPFWSLTTIKRTIRSLENQKLLFVSNYNKAKFDKTKWYSIDYIRLERLHDRMGQNDPIEDIKMTSRIGQNDLTNRSKRPHGVGQNEPTYTRDYQETTTKTTTTTTKDDHDDYIYNTKNSNSDTSNNKKASSSFDFYQQNGFGMLQPFIADQIGAWLDDFKENGDEIVIEAMKVSLMNNKTNWNYANGILKAWYQKGIKSVEDIQALENQRSKQSNGTDGQLKGQALKDAMQDPDYWD